MYNSEPITSTVTVVGERPVRIACVYVRGESPRLASMAWIRCFRMSEAFARRGHQVDIITDRLPQPRAVGTRLREVPFRLARWENYDVVKTLFHTGFESLLAHGGGDHPFIVSKLGSVVGRGQTAGVHFFGPTRQRLFDTQIEIARRSPW
jgi:hypothetical protein